MFCFLSHIWWDICLWMMSDVLKGIHLQYACCKSFHGKNNALIFVGKILAETKNLNILQKKKKIHMHSTREDLGLNRWLVVQRCFSRWLAWRTGKKSLPELGSYNLTEQDLSSIPLKLMYLHCCKKIIWVFYLSLVTKITSTF